MPADADGKSPARPTPKTLDGVGRHHRFAVTLQVIKIGPVFPEEDLVSGSPRVNAIEVWDSCFSADLTSGCRSGDVDHVSLTERVNAVALHDSPGGLIAPIVVPREGVHGEHSDGTASNDRERDEPFHGKKST